jgi:hypothetical protein
MIELTASEGLLDEIQDVLLKNPEIEKVLVSRLTLHNALPPEW